MSERELQVRDLLLKLQVLTYGLLQERKKSQSYLDRIKELQDTLQKNEWPFEILYNSDEHRYLKYHISIPSQSHNHTLSLYNQDSPFVQSPSPLPI